MSARAVALFSPRVVVGVIARPRLWATAIRVLRSHSMTRANGKPRLLPRLARPYLDFRMETQYGRIRESQTREILNREILNRDLTMIDTGSGESPVSHGRLTSDEVEDVLKYLEWVREWNSRR